MEGRTPPVRSTLRTEKRPDNWNKRSVFYVESLGRSVNDILDLAFRLIRIDNYQEVVIVCPMCVTTDERRGWHDWEESGQAGLMKWRGRKGAYRGGGDGRPPRARILLCSKKG